MNALDDRPAVDNAPNGKHTQNLAKVTKGNYICFQFGYHTEGLEAVVDKLIGPTGILTMKKSILDLLRSPRSVTGKDKIEEIIKKVDRNSHSH